MSIPGGNAELKLGPNALMKPSVIGIVQATMPNGGPYGYSYGSSAGVVGDATITATYTPPASNPDKFTPTYGTVFWNGAIKAEYDTVPGSLSIVALSSIEAEVRDFNFTVAPAKLSDVKSTTRAGQLFLSPGTQPTNRSLVGKVAFKAKVSCGGGSTTTKARTEVAFTPQISPPL
jgi:hypothetical protein